MFWGKVTVEGGVAFNDWSEGHLVKTAACGWLAVHWVAAAGNWLEVRWVTAASEWLAVLWLAGEGDWLEVHWVVVAEFGSCWPKVSVSASFWVDKMWINDSETDIKQLWSALIF